MSNIEKFAKLQGFDKIEPAGKWRGYNVYKPVYEEEVTVGLPLVILVKGNNIRMSTPDEAFAIIDDME